MVTKGTPPTTLVVTGRIHPADDPAATIDVSLHLGNTVVLRSRHGELGSWPRADVDIRPATALRFTFVAEGDDLVFLPDNPPALEHFLATEPAPRRASFLAKRRTRRRLAGRAKTEGTPRLRRRAAREPTQDANDVRRRVDAAMVGPEGVPQAAAPTETSSRSAAPSKPPPPPRPVEERTVSFGEATAARIPDLPSAVERAPHVDRGPVLRTDRDPAPHTDSTPHTERANDEASSGGWRAELDAFAQILGAGLETAVPETAVPETAKSGRAEPPVSPRRDATTRPAPADAVIDVRDGDPRLPEGWAVDVRPHESPPTDDTATEDAVDRRGDDSDDDPPPASALRPAGETDAAEPRPGVPSGTAMVAGDPTPEAALPAPPDKPGRIARLSRKGWLWLLDHLRQTDIYVLDRIPVVTDEMRLDPDHEHDYEVRPAAAGLQRMVCAGCGKVRLAPPPADPQVAFE